MERRTFFKTVVGAAAGLLAGLSGCMARVSETAKDLEKGDPWRCSKCGSLVCYQEDLANHRCPRCRTKNYQRVSEEEFEKWLAA